jgi:hypothetical protein
MERNALTPLQLIESLNLYLLVYQIETFRQVTIRLMLQSSQVGVRIRELIEGMFC